MWQYFKFLAYCLLAMHSMYANDILRKLDERMVRADSLVCVGLDPDAEKIPLSIMSSDHEVEENVFAFLSQVVDITAPHICAYKVQKAFFDRFENGYTLLRRICTYVHVKYPDVPVFVDCKIGDTDNTMQAYMQLLFDDIRADGVVVNPYMGDDVLEPFMKDSNKVGLVLIQTSNPNAKVVQELALKNGQKLWEEMLHLTLTRWNKNGNLIPILSSNTSLNNYSSIRKRIPQEVPILLAGIGSQGGNPQVMKQLLNDKKRGVFVNSSRGILYPYQPNEVNWQNEVLRAVLSLKAELNDIRNGVK